MTFTLRPYQADLVSRTCDVVHRGGVPAVVAPTGSGKTVMIAELARRELDQGRRVVVVAHRQEIIGQLQASLAAHNPGREIELVVAGQKSRMLSDITIGMIPTMARRLKHLHPLHGATLLQDECHHAGAVSWEKVTEAIRPSRRVGFTATPVRPNGQGLGDEGGFTELVIGPQVRELIEMGALCPFKVFGSPTVLSTAHLRKIAGDFRMDDIDPAEVRMINTQIVPEWKRVAQGAKTITVAMSVDHGLTLEALFRDAGVNARSVFGTTSKEDRREVFDSFRSPDGVEVLVACAVVDEGLDVPQATCLQLTRPTASLRLYRQLVGRVLRPAPGKEHALLLDHTDTAKRMPWPDEDVIWELHAPPKTEREIEREAAEAARKEEKLYIQEQLQEIKRQIRRPKPAWLRKQVQKDAAARLSDLEDPVVDLLPLVPLLTNDQIIRVGERCGMGPRWAQSQIWFRDQTPNLKERALAAAKDWVKDFEVSERLLRGVGSTGPTS